MRTSRGESSRPLQKICMIENMQNTVQAKENTLTMYLNGDDENILE